MTWQNTNLTISEKGHQKSSKDGVRDLRYLTFYDHNTWRVITCVIEDAGLELGMSIGQTNMKII